MSNLNLDKSSENNQDSFFHKMHYNKNDVVNEEVNRTFCCNLNRKNEVNNIENLCHKENMPKIQVIIERKENPLLEITPDIYENALKDQTKNRPNYSKIFRRNYNKEKRKALFEWIALCLTRFQNPFDTETLYCIYNILDRYFEKTKTVPNDLKLYAITAFFIAAKYEEIYTPDSCDYVELLENKYNIKNIVACEIEVMKAINFDCYFISPFFFLNFYFYDNHPKNTRTNTYDDIDILYLAQFFMEITFISEPEYCNAKPSVIAASALFSARTTLYYHVFFARKKSKKKFDNIEDKINYIKRNINLKVSDIKRVWTNDMHAKTGYDAESLKKYRRLVFESVKNYKGDKKSTKSLVVYLKYADKIYNEISVKYREIIKY